MKAYSPAPSSVGTLKVRKSLINPHKRCSYSVILIRIRNIRLFMDNFTNISGGGNVAV